MIGAWGDHKNDVVCGKLSDFFGGEVLGTLSNNSLSENQKTSILATLGAKFRRDVLLAGRLQAIDSELNSIRIKMLDNSIVEKPRYELDEMYKQQKNMLKNERKSILAEQKEITKKHGK